MPVTYAQKLKDPRWQKRRLEALQLSDFHCQMCCDGASTLHVHHKQYFKGREPWEYDVRQLAVLCEDCHRAHHESEDELNLVGSFLAVDGPYSRHTAASLISGFAGVTEENGVSDQTAYHSGILAANVFCQDWRVKASELRELSELSYSHGTGMLDALRAYASSIKASV